MRILLAGHKGQLGRALISRLVEQHDVRGIDLPDDDITDRDAGVADGKLLRIHIPLRTSDDVIFNGLAPAGAKFGYNISKHPDLEKVWPPTMVPPLWAL